LHIPREWSVMGDRTKAWTDDKAMEPATQEQEERVMGLLRRGLDQGALGIGGGSTTPPGDDSMGDLNVLGSPAERRRLYAALRSMGPD